MDSNFLQGELIKMQNNYSNKPKKWIRLKRPSWLSLKDPMSKVYSEKRALLKRGEVTYASIVQANTMLFHKFPSCDCPAQVVYSSDTYVKENPYMLYDIARYIFDYKGEPEENIPDEWKSIARAVTDEYDRTGFTFGLEINGYTVGFHLIPTMIFRKLLPKKKLCGKILPVLVSPECKQILILPKKYWTKEFTRAWVKKKV